MISKQKLQPEKTILFIHQTLQQGKQYDNHRCIIKDIEIFFKPLLGYIKCALRHHSWTLQFFEVDWSFYQIQFLFWESACFNIELSINIMKGRFINASCSLQIFSFWPSNRTTCNWHFCNTQSTITLESLTTYKLEICLVCAKYKSPHSSRNSLLVVVPLPQPIWSVKKYESLNSSRILAPRLTQTSCEAPSNNPIGMSDKIRICCYFRIFVALFFMIFIKITNGI